MTPRSVILGLALSLVACAGPTAAPPQPPPASPPPSLPAPAPTAPSSPRPSWAAEYPVARISDSPEPHFGTAVHDPYRWLEDGTSPEVTAWAEAEDAVTRKHLDAIPERAPLVARFRELLYTESRGVPDVRKGRLFFSSRSAAQEKDTIVWRDGRDAHGSDHVLLDPNSWPTTDNPSLNEWHPSHDGKKLAYSVSLHNQDESSVRVLDVASGKESTVDAIPELLFPQIAWSPDDKGFYYRSAPRTPPGTPVAERHALVEARYHRLGDDPKNDALVHAKTGDPTAFLASYPSRDGHWLFAVVDHGDTNAVEFRDARAKGAPWAMLFPPGKASAQVEEYRDRFYVMSNDGAPNWRLFAVDPAHADRAQWKEVVPERRDARLDSFRILGGRLVLSYLKDATSRLEVHALSGALERELALPAIGTADLPSGEQDSDDAYFGFSSFTYAPEVERVSIAKGTESSWYRTPVAVDLSRFVVEQVFFTSKDGTRVPTFVVHAKDMKKDGSAPTFLAGYGGFDLVYGPEFKPQILPWLERGGVYAWVGLRGGGEYGETWHRAGMRHSKQNVFDDFIAGAEYLIHEGYTSSDRLVAYGRSNGGLLVGAAATQRPDLFRAILCGAPVLDMVRFAKVGGGKLWVDEYGDAESEGDFRALYAYSPVHHVTDGVRYPSVFMFSPMNDDRVDPMHARKFVAELQAASTGGPVLFRLERDSGHGGAGKRGHYADLFADELAFALAEIGHVGGSMQQQQPAK